MDKIGSSGIKILSPESEKDVEPEGQTERIEHEIFDELGMKKSYIINPIKEEVDESVEINPDNVSIEI